MIEDIKEAALDYINSGRERNFYATNRKVTLQVYGQAVDVESIWKGEDNDKVYLHCGCKEFEADVDLESLSTENQERVREVLACEDITDEQVPRLMQMHEGKPLVFLFRVADVDREEVNRVLSREECFKRCAKFYTLDELGDAWNDTDDDMRCLMDVKKSWCYVSQPEPKKPEKVWVVTFINDTEWELPNVSVNVLGTKEEARQCLDDEWQTLTTEGGEWQEDVSRKDDDEFMFVDSRENRVFGEINEKTVKLNNK